MPTSIRSSHSSKDITGTADDERLDLLLSIAGSYNDTINDHRNSVI